MGSRVTRPLDHVIYLSETREERFEEIDGRGNIFGASHFPYGMHGELRRTNVYRPYPSQAADDGAYCRPASAVISHDELLNVLADCLANFPDEEGRH